MGFPNSSAGKESACNVGDLGSIPGLGRSPGEGKGYPLQYSGLENSMDCIVYGVAESDTTERLSLTHSTLYYRAFPMTQQVKNPPAMQETQEMWVCFVGWEDPLEEEMVNHSSIFSWKIPQTEVSGRLLFMGSQESDITEWLSMHTQPFIITMFILLWKFWQLLLLLHNCYLPFFFPLLLTVWLRVLVESFSSPGSWLSWLK